MGFFGKYSTIINLFSYLNLVIDAISEVHFVYTDFTKVSHSTWLNTVFLWNFMNSSIFQILLKKPYK